MTAIRSAIEIPNTGYLNRVANYIVTIILFLGCSYSIYFLFDREFVSQLVVEDGFFEYLTAVLFFAASIVFFLAFLSQKNKFLLLLSIAMFVGAGEEISWGQRIFDFATPENLAAVNVQNEFNFHNIELVNGVGLGNEKKYGIRKILTINFLYKLFWLTYCVLLPIGVISFNSIRRFVQEIKLPDPPLWLGIFFLINWLTYRIILVSFLMDNLGYEIGEVRECASAFLFATLGVYFLNNPCSVRQSEAATHDSATSAVP